MDYGREEQGGSSWIKNPVNDRRDYYEQREHPQYREYPPAPVYEQQFDADPRDTPNGAGGAGGGGFIDCFNGNQPVYPTLEDRQPQGGRKRPLVDNSAFYPPKVPRSHDSRPGSFGNRFGSGGDSSVILQEESRKCIGEMSQELAMLEQSSAPDVQFLTHTKRLLTEEINKITTNMNPDWLDVESPKFSVKILKRILLPPARGGNNVVGRILGVGGQTLRKMCQTYKCHISICGAGSRKNPMEEQELLATGDPRHSHLACPLHAEISTTGPPHLAYTRLGQILTLLQRVITSDESFEHDGMLFEFAQRRRDGPPDGYDDYREDRGHPGGEYDGPPRRGRGSFRGRPSPRGEDQNNAWRGNGNDGDGGTEFRHSPRAEDSVGRGGGGAHRGPRGRGGFVPRGRGFIPRGGRPEGRPE